MPTSRRTTRKQTAVARSHHSPNDPIAAALGQIIRGVRAGKSAASIAGSIERLESVLARAIELCPIGTSPSPPGTLRNRLIAVDYRLRGVLQHIDNSDISVLEGALEVWLSHADGG